MRCSIVIYYAMVSFAHRFVFLEIIIFINFPVV